MKKINFKKSGTPRPRRMAEEYYFYFIKKNQYS